MPDLSKAGIDLTPFYGLIGAVIVAQFGTIVMVIGWVFKIGVWKGMKDANDQKRDRDLNAAHEKIRELQNKGE